MVQPHTTATGTFLVALSPDDLTTVVRNAVTDALASHTAAQPGTPTLPPSTVDADLLSVAETARLLRVSRQTLREMERRGELLPCRLGRRVLYRRSDINAALDRRNTVAYRGTP